MSTVPPVQHAGTAGVENRARAAAAARRWAGGARSTLTLRGIVRLWLTSLQFRTVVVTVLLTGTAIAITGGVVSYSVGGDLYQSRLSQATAETARAVSSAQQGFDAADDTDPASVRQLLTSAVGTIQATTSTSLIAAYRAPGQSSDPYAPIDFTTFGPTTSELITPALRRAVRGGGQFVQSVALPREDGGTAPGLVVGSEVTLPAAGRYELYVGFDLADSEETLLYVQRTLLLAGLALVVLIGAVTWVVVRFVVAPIRITAATSERLAAGDLAVRIPERGSDLFATLARSYNRMADSLQRQITQLAALSQLQQRFVSDVSHELRTPLTTIRLAGDVIYDQRDDFPVATARSAELLHAQVERFDSLLSDLLEISRYDAGSARLETETTNLVHLASDGMDAMAQLAEQAGCPVTLEAPGGHVDVEIDPRRIRRVLANLLGNAIEHGEGRGITVLVDSNESAVALAVRDHGSGMTSGETAHVFDRFWRADPARRRTIGGTGLGLAISLEDATLHGGWLQVWSQPGDGTCFRLTLPRRPGALLALSPLPLPPADALAPEARRSPAREDEPRTDALAPAPARAPHAAAGARARVLP